MIRKTSQYLLLMLIFLSTTASVKALDTLRISLVDARNMAMKNNTSILNSELDLKIAQKKIWETTAIGLPHFDAKASYQHIPNVPTLPASFMGGGSAAPDSMGSQGAGAPVIELGVKNNITYDFTVSQLIFNGAYIVGLKASKTYYALSAQNLEKSKRDVNEVVANTYTMILVAEESRIVLNKNLENINKTLYEIGEMHKQGFLEKTDVSQLELTANTIKNALNQIESNIDVAYRLLKIQIGIAENIPVALTDKLASSEMLTTTSMSLLGEAFNVSKNIDFQLMETYEMLANLDYKREKTGYLPTITAFYNHQEKWKTPLFDFAPKDIIGVTLSLPVFSSGERMAKVSQRRMSFEKAQNSKLLVSSSLETQASQYKNDLKLKLEKFQIQKKGKELSDEIYSKTLEKYKEGVSSSMDLMNSHNQYLMNLTNYYQSIYELENSKSKLEKLYSIDIIK